MGGGTKVRVFQGSQTLGVVGESYYADNLKMLVDDTARRAHTEGDKIRIPCHAILVAETDNPYDDNAISVWVSGYKVGHLSREDAAAYRPGLLALQEKHGMEIALEGEVVGNADNLGVFLVCDPEDFGVAGRRSAGSYRGSRVRTGLSEAWGTDGEDDSYNLSWMDELPSDTAKRIPRLRKLLDDDTDPIDRHYMLTQLEKDLYSCRDLWETALEEYDTVAEQHHAELVEGIRTALVAKFGSVPLIDTYRQACIRSQKAGDWKGALRWAERGLKMYGNDAARPETVEDLRRRAAKARDKLS